MIYTILQYQACSKRVMQCYVCVLDYFWMLKICCCAHLQEQSAVTRVLSILMQ